MKKIDDLKIANARVDEALINFDDWFIRYVTETVSSSFPFINYSIGMKEYGISSIIFGTNGDCRKISYEIYKIVFDDKSYKTAYIKILTNNPYFGQQLYVSLSGRINNSSGKYKGKYKGRNDNIFSFLPIIIGPDPRMDEEAQENNLNKCINMVNRTILEAIKVEISPFVEEWLKSNSTMNMRKYLGV